MKQKQFMPLSVADIAISLFAVEKGYLDDVDIDKVVSFEHDLHACFRNNFKDLLDSINLHCSYNKEIEDKLNNVLKEFKNLRK